MEKVPNRTVLAYAATAFPSAMAATPMAIVWNYPITEARHARRVGRLERRAQRNSLSPSSA